MSGTSSRWYLRHDSASVVVGAEPEVVYDLVAELSRMGDWSPECQQVEWEAGGADAAGPVGPVVGARFVGHNRGGPAQLMKWSRHGTVRTADRGREFVFATEEGGREGTVWSYRFEPTEGGTLVTESYRVDWIPLWARIVDVPTNRAKELREGMRHTLDQLKTAAESVGSERTPA